MKVDCNVNGSELYFPRYLTSFLECETISADKGMNKKSICTMVQFRNSREETNNQYHAV